MKKTICIVAITLLGCNYGTSLSNQDPSGGSAAGGSGNGTATAGAGGTSGPNAGGATASGGRSGGGGGDNAGQGGATGTASGGSAAAGAPGTGGNNGNGSDAATDAGRGSDSGSADTRAVPGTGGSPSTGGVSGSGGASGTGGASTACIPAAPAGAKAMNPGQACLNCHSGKKQPTITFGGTLFNSATGGSAVSGATVTVTDTNGKVVSVVTGPTGNFYTSDALVFPATVQISKCPDTVSMVAAAASGDCNSCHTSAKQIHLP